MRLLSMRMQRYCEQNEPELSCVDSFLHYYINPLNLHPIEFKWSCLEMDVMR